MKSQQALRVKSKTKASSIVNFTCLHLKTNLHTITVVIRHHYPVLLSPSYQANQSILYHPSHPTRDADIPTQHHLTLKTVTKETVHAMKSVFQPMKTTATSLDS